MKENTLHLTVFFLFTLVLCVAFLCSGACQQESANVDDEIPERELEDDDSDMTPINTDDDAADDDSSDDDTADDDTADDDSTDDDTTDDDTTDDDTTDDDDDSTTDYPNDHDTVWDCYLCHEIQHGNTYAAPSECLGCHSQGDSPSAPRAGMPSWHLISGNCVQCHGVFKHDKPFSNEMYLTCHSKQFTRK